MDHAKTKIVTLLLALLMLAAALPCAEASALDALTSYELTEIAMTIDVPSETAVITSSVKKSNVVFRNGTFDYITAMSKMRDDSALLYGRNVKDDYYIEVICTENEDHIKDLTKLNEKKQQKLLAEYGAQEDIVSSSVYSNGSFTFFYASRTTNGASGRFFYSDYYTVYKGNDITIRLISENDNITSGELDILKTVADSIRFPAKRRFSFAQVKGRGVFVTFIIISAAFLLVFFYRRHDEKVNAVILPIASKCKAFISEKASAVKAKSGEKTKRSENVKAAIAENADESDITAAPESVEDASQPASEDEDEDLSSIDLDAAIAFFDDGSAEL